MSWFRDHCAILAPPEAVLHIGAGVGDDFEAYRERPGSRVYLVEPQASCVERLERLAAGLEHVQVVQLAAAADSGTRGFHVLSVPRYSGFLAANAFHAQMPGLFETARIEVETASLADMVTRFHLRPDGDNWLVVDAPGVEASMVDALCELADGLVFSHVFLTAGAGIMAQDIEPMSSLAERLGAIGYRPVGDHDAGDGDWPRSHFVMDSVARETGRLASEARGLRKKLSVMEAEHRSALARKDEALEAQRIAFEARDRAAGDALSIARTEVESLQARFDVLEERERAERESAKELQGRWQALKEEFDLSTEAAQAHVKEVQGQLSQLQEQHSELQGQHSELQGQHSELQRQHSALREQADARMSEWSQLRQTGERKLAELTAALDARQARYTVLEREMTEWRDRVERNDTRSREMEDRLDKARDDLSVALRAQAQRETDLEDLRGRYAELMDLKERQQELLQKLHRRLGAASEYLKHISGEGDDHAPGSQAARLARALSGDFEPGN